MVLSRFWLALFLGSIVSLFVALAFGGRYTLDFAINGKKDDPIPRAEYYLAQLPPALADTLARAPEGKLAFGKDSLYTIERRKLKPGDDSAAILRSSIVKLHIGKQPADGLLPTAKAALLDLLLPLIAYLAFFAGVLQLLIDSGASERIAKLLSPVFVKVFPEIPRGHPSISYMMLNFAANFLGLDSAATPFGLKAMESLQELNGDKERASNSQIMFMCLHAAGLTLIPTSIIGYRAAQGAQNPADVMLPCIITSFIGTVAELVIVGIRQRIRLLNATLVLTIGGLVAVIAALLVYITRLDIIGKGHFTGNLSTALLLGIIFIILAYAWLREKRFAAQGKTVFNSFVEGAYNGLDTGRVIFPYILGMLVAISLFRNSGLFDVLALGLTSLFGAIGVSKDITDALPIAILRPFNAAGSRGFLIDAMRTYGADSFTGRLASVFQCAAETTFYVIAVYFGAIRVKNTRYTLGAMLIVDLVCVFAAVFMCLLFF